MHTWPPASPAQRDHSHEGLAGGDIRQLRHGDKGGVCSHDHDRCLRTFRDINLLFRNQVCALSFICGATYNKLIHKIEASSAQAAPCMKNHHHDQEIQNMTGTKRQQVGRHETHRARESRAITDRQEAVQGETSAARMKMRTDKCIVLTRADFLAHQLPQHVSAAASNTHSRFLQASLSNGLCVAPAHSQTNQPSP